MIVLSLGVGVQSSTLYFQSSLNSIQRADYAVFADTGSESANTYKYLEYIQKWCANNNGIPIIVIKQNLYEDAMRGLNKAGKKFLSIPVYGMEGGKRFFGQRQCTKHYKIETVFKAIRSLYGLLPKKRTPKTDVLIGISTDEILRMKPSRYKTLTNIFPLIDKNMSRDDCKQWLKDNGFIIPPKSSCIFCPYNNDLMWLEEKTNRPDEFEKSCILDDAIRNVTGKGDTGTYLHQSCKPLREVEFKNKNNVDINLFNNECEGMCGL